MRTISDLVKDKSFVWVYLDNERICREFYRQAHEEGFHFGDYPYEKWAVGYVIGVHRNRDMGHVPIFCWHTSFCCIDTDNSLPTRIDYEKYAAGEEDYICRESHFKGGVVLNGEPR